MWFEAEADSTDKCKPFEIKTEDISDHDDKLRPYLCTMCEESFSSKDGLRYHKNIHIGRYNCTECGKCFGSSCTVPSLQCQ